MTPRELEGMVKQVERNLERLGQEFGRRLEQQERKLLRQINELKNRPEHYSPAPRDPIIPPPFPEALAELGLEEPDGTG